MRFISLVLILAISLQASAQIFSPRIRYQSRCVGNSCAPQILYFASPTDPNDSPNTSKPEVPIIGAKPTDLQEDYDSDLFEVQADDRPVPKGMNFGVDWEKINDHKVTYNGREISCVEAIERIESQVPNDADKLRLVVIGDSVDTDAFAKEWKNVDQQTANRVSTWICGPTHWSLKDTVTGEPRFKTDGKPTIYLLAPDGESLGRMDNFVGVDDVQAIRKAVKKYDAAKDSPIRIPDPPKKDDSKNGNPVNQPSPFKPAAFVVGAATALYFFSRKANRQ